MRTTYHNVGVKHYLCESCACLDFDSENECTKRIEMPYSGSDGAGCKGYERYNGEDRRV